MVPRGIWGSLDAASTHPQIFHRPLPEVDFFCPEFRLGVFEAHEAIIAAEKTGAPIASRRADGGHLMK